MVPARQKLAAAAYPIINLICVFSALYHFLFVPGYTIGILFAATWPLLNYFTVGYLNKFMQGGGVSPKQSYYQAMGEFWWKNGFKGWAKNLSHDIKNFKDPKGQTDPAPKIHLKNRF